MKSSSNARKKIPKIDEMSKEQIRNTIIKKRETNARAQRIVETFLEPGLSEDLFLSYLPHINQSHLDDVVAERAIIGVCGYPLCHNKLLVKDIPKQQYRISTKSNKVYDITARKSFCCNRCYKSLVFIKQQLLTSPLWFREYEIVPTFQLMPSDTVAGMGQEIDLSIVEKIKTDSSQFISINEFTNASFNVMDKEFPSLSDGSLSCEYKDEKSNITIPEVETEVEHDKEAQNAVTQTCKNPLAAEPDTEFNIKSDLKLHDLESDDVNDSRIILEDLKFKEDKADVPRLTPNERNKDIINPLSVIGNIIERPEKKIDTIITAIHESKTAESTKHSKCPDTIATLIIHVEKCFAEWLTLNSMIFLFGEAKVKVMVEDKEDCIKKHLNNRDNGLLYSSSSCDQYKQLCRKLKMLEIEDRRYDSQVIGKDTKPLPDYSIIKEEGKRMELKVKAFLSGEQEFTEDTQSLTKIENEDLSDFTHLPLFDNNALRRKIVFTNLTKALHDLEWSLGLQGNSVLSEVRLLVNSFKLKANNVMFKPIQWTLIGVVVIRLLSLRDSTLQRSLGSTEVDRNLRNIMSKYNQNDGYLDRLVLWLTDIDRLLDTKVTQLTVE